ncbi:TPT-domain-containing protein [Xylona heveae TC161]|uniref:TPT-domain-containing protein n=1 Tax=Xylona heveae (strain CBS 132557 / TC161) TaxID=1328760 RepID=A0A161TQ27_XYLHT|nr:TPT-domain-containing protein [Xylona heveae TC161]KZF24396.1 TPT-domain-containing protein [Xylona heveae TC161]
MGESSTAHRRRKSSLVGGSPTEDLSNPSRTSTTIAEYPEPPTSGHGELVHTTTTDEDILSDHGSQVPSEELELGSLASDEEAMEDEELGLTRHERRDRRTRKRRHMRMDERVVEDPKYSREEEQVADRAVVKKSIVNGILICLWYFFSLSISLYNKWMFSEKHLNFKYPLFTTCLHMLVQFTLASLVLFFFPHFRPRHDSLNPRYTHHHSHARNDSADAHRPIMTRYFYITRIGPCGAATGLDIGLGNMSLKFIRLTFYTMCKSSALAFVLLFAFIFKLETPSTKLVLIIFTMTVGVIMMVAGETAFNALGFILIISSAFCSGFRWALTQILLLRNPATSNPFSSIFFLAPVMFTSLFIIALPVEGPSEIGAGLADLFERKGTPVSIGLLLFPGTLAFLMTSSEFALLQRTSVVTLSICGIFKEVVTIIAANLTFKEHSLTPINFSGLLVTMGSIAAYNYIKVVKMRQDARADAYLGHEDADGYTPIAGGPDGLSSEADTLEARPRSAVRAKSATFGPHGSHLTGVSHEVQTSGNSSPVKRPEDQE